MAVNGRALTSELMLYHFLRGGTRVDASPVHHHISPMAINLETLPRPFPTFTLSLDRLDSTILMLSLF